MTRPKRKDMEKALVDIAQGNYDGRCMGTEVDYDCRKRMSRRQMMRVARRVLDAAP